MFGSLRQWLYLGQCIDALVKYWSCWTKLFHLPFFSWLVKGLVFAISQAVSVATAYLPHFKIMLTIVSLL